MAQVRITPWHYFCSGEADKRAEKEKAEAQFTKLIGALDGVGLRTEVRDGGSGNALVFVRVRSEQKLVGEVYRSRLVPLT